MVQSAVNHHNLTHQPMIQSALNPDNLTKDIRIRGGEGVLFFLHDGFFIRFVQILFFCQ